MAVICKQTKLQFPERAVSIFLFLIVATYKVAQLFEALRYRPESRGIDSRCCHWNRWLAYTLCSVNNGTAFNRQNFLSTLSILPPPTPENVEIVYTDPRKRARSPARETLSVAWSHHFGCR